MNKDLKRLKDFLKDCRYDMHEPDEQDVSAIVVGDHLDNAFGDAILYPTGNTYQEYVVVLKHGIKEERFNLATLIALARTAKLENLN